MRSAVSVPCATVRQVAGSMRNHPRVAGAALSSMPMATSTTLLLRLQSFKSASAGADETRNEIAAAGSATAVRAQYRRIAALKRSLDGRGGDIARVTYVSACRCLGW